MKEDGNNYKLMFASSTNNISAYKELFISMNDAFDSSAKQAVVILWNILLTFLSQYWIYVLLVIFFISLIAVIRAKFGRWGMLGRVLYNLFYFSIIFVIVAIWGPEIFVNSWVNSILAAVLYKVCYYLVGLILDKVK